MLSMVAGMFAGGALGQPRSDISVNYRGLAIGGYDAIAYFETGQAAPGMAAYEFLWRGARWRFASEETMARFARDPDRFAPAYGGHCAFAAAHGRVRQGDPQIWDIVGGRLFLKASVDAQRRWRTNPKRFISVADAKWPQLSREFF